jgi:hypothetical protein
MSEKQPNIVLNDVRGLYELLSGHKLSLFPREGNIKLEFVEITESEKNKWQSKLQQYYFACGCKQGSMTSLIFFLSYWLYIFIFVGVKSILSWEVWVLSFACLISGAIIGKVVGLIYSRYALIIAVRKLMLAISKNLQ